MLIRTIVATCLLVASYAQAEDFKPIDLTPPSSFLGLKENAIVVLSAPMRWEPQTWRKVGIGVGLIGGLMLIDDHSRDEFLRHSNRTAARIADAAEPFGSDYSWAVLAGFYGAGKFLGNSRAAAIAEDGFNSSVIAAGIITPTLKAIAGRSRPSQTSREYDFLRGDGSFPSGHTTQAFALASVIASHYDSFWIDALAYAIASLVGYARIDNKAHFASDVVAGAAIGMAVGKTVVRLNDERRRIQLEPMVGISGGAGLSVRLDLSRK